jgi:autotransporter-associated beta strand protein
MKKRLLLLSAISLACAIAGGTTLTWTGGSQTSDNFSDADNWSPSQAPASGDTLVFRGETRTTPYNDLDPDSYTFAKIVFTNDNSAGLSAPFTLTGNKLKLVGSITGIKTTSGSLTDTFDLEVEFTGKPWLGVASTSSRNYVFNKKVSGPTNQSMENPGQYQGTVYFNGDIEGFDSFSHPNGSINVYFRGVNNAFSHASGYNFNQGYLYFIDAATFGPAPIVRSGQGWYSTAGSVCFDPTNDVTITAKIGVTAPSQSNNGLTLVNRTAGTTVTFTGDVVESGTKEANGSNAGTRLVVDGAGNGVFKGNFTKDRMAFTKLGAGTWILSDEIETCSMTGLVTVSAGKLVVDCALQPNQYMTIASSGTIAGKGTLGAPVTFKSTSKYEVSVNGDGTHNTLTIPGAITLEGNVTVNRTGGAALAPGSRTKLLEFDSKSGSGSFIAGSGFPANAVLLIEDGVLYAQIPSESLVWNGEASSEWNTTDANWDGGALFADGKVVSFPDLVDAAKRTISIPSTVKPMNLAVTASADRPYSFSGPGSIEDAVSIEFSGTATNTVSVPVRNAAMMQVTAGRFVMDGEIANSVVTIGNDATLTQTVSSAVSGTSILTLYGARADLCGTNSFTGGLVIGHNDNSGLPRTDVYVRTPNAIGAGDLSVCYKSYLYVNADCAVTNRTLHFWGYNNYCQVNVKNNTVFDWAGDIVVHEYPNGEVLFADTGTFKLGKSDLTSTFSTTHGRGVGLVGNIHMYANFSSGSGLSFRNNFWLYSTNNMWSGFGINTGNAYMMAKNALPGDKPISMLQQWNNVQYQANLYLNGFDQTVAAINVTDYNHNIQNWARIKSTLPATLTVSNATASSFNDVTTFYVQECVTLRKMGLGKWTIGCQNTSTGDFEVVEGAVSIAAADSLPVGEKSTLRIHEGATLDLPSGVNAEISLTERIVAGKTRMVRAGLYGGEECEDPAAIRVAWITGAGTLRVKRDHGGTILIFH